MCNAWNHSATCNCGFGGEGHSGGQGITGSSSEDSCRLSTCKHCGKSVYFIRHNGGAIWVNPPLGSPWPKHPCYGLSDENHSALSKTLSVSHIQSLLQASAFDAKVEELRRVSGTAGKHDMGIFIQSLDGNITFIPVRMDKDVMSKFLKLIDSAKMGDRDKSGLAFAAVYSDGWVQSYKSVPSNPASLLSKQ